MFCRNRVNFLLFIFFFCFAAGNRCNHFTFTEEESFVRVHDNWCGVCVALLAVQIQGKCCCLDTYTITRFLFFFSVSRGEQERSKAAEETSILSLKDRTRLHTLIDPTQTSQSGWHNRNTALFPYHLKSPYLKKLNYVRPKWRPNVIWRGKALLETGNLFFPSKWKKTTAFLSLPHAGNFPSPLCSHSFSLHV